MEDKELDLSNINQIDMEVNFIDDDDDSFGNIGVSNSLINNDENIINTDDREVKRVTGIKIDLSDDVPTLTSKPIKCTSEQDILDAVNDKNTPFGLSQNSSGIFGEDPDYMECSVGEDDDDFVPRKSFDYEDEEEEPELVNEDIINEKRPARVSQGQVEDDYWEKIAKKHKATNVKGAHNLHTHYGGDPKLAMDMFNHDMEPQGKIPTITDAQPAAVIATDSAYTSDVASGVGEASGGDGGACCGESKKQDKGSKQLFENLLLITGFELIPDGEQFILKDKCGMVDDMQCADEKECIVNLKPYIDDSFITPLQYQTGEKFTEPEEWCNWYNDDKQKQYPKCSDDIKYCELIKNLLSK